MSAPSPASPANACSVLSAALGESAYGSAGDALAWVCLEQNGPWGRAAATQSHLDPDLGGRLDAAISAVGGRFALIRRSGAHPDDPTHRVPRTVLVASVTGRGWVLRAELDDPADLGALDVDALGRGDRDAVIASLSALEPDAAPTLLVCTNGRRDVCCAVRGRPVAAGASTLRPGQVWETSHTGGHRFAPTGVLLPSGQTLARLDVDLAVAALDGAAVGELLPALHGPVHDRGASGLAPHERAAVSAVRYTTGARGLDNLSVGDARGTDETSWRIDVRHGDGRWWPCTATREVLGPDRPDSCIKQAVPQVGWTVTVGDPT